MGVLSSIGTGVTSVVTNDLKQNAILGVKVALTEVDRGIEFGNELESYRLKLNAVMKDTKKAGETMQWASNYANITPLDADKVLEGTLRLETSEINAKRAMRSIGDMTTVMNKDLMLGIDAVVLAQTGDLNKLKEFGITKVMLEKKAGEMYRNQTVMNSKGEIVDQEKFNETLFALMDERFKGGMEKQSSSLKGTMSGIKDTWKTGMAAIVGVSASGEISENGIFAQLKVGAESLASTLNSWVDSGVFQRIGESIASVLSKLAETYNFFSNNWSVISPIIYAVVGTLAAYKAAVIAGDLWTIIYGDSATGAGGKVKSLSVAQKGLNATMRANPIGLVITLLGVLVTAGIYVVQNWEAVKLAGMHTWNVLVGAVQWGVNAFISYANFMLTAYIFAWDMIEYAGKSIWNGIISGAEVGVNGFLGIIDFMINGALKGINTLIDGANKVSNALGQGNILQPLTFGGIGKVNLSGAMANTELPKFDINSKIIPSVDLSAAKFSEDSIMAQTKKAQEERANKKGSSEAALTEALNTNTDALTSNTSVTGGNTKATTSNTETLKDNSSAIDIADSLLGRIERHLYAT